MHYLISLHTHAHILNGFEEHLEILLRRAVYILIILPARTEPIPTRHAVTAIPYVNILFSGIPESVAEIYALPVNLSALGVNNLYKRRGILSVNSG